MTLSGRVQRPFQQEFRGALGTRSAIINYGKERGVRCKQAPPVRVSRSGGSQRESNWEHAEVAKEVPFGGTPRNGKGSAGQRKEREREKEIIKYNK